ncbi:cytokine receptor common subunit gamma [Dromiciops gliroides]|uniref:cytokine receptor common subunit gamma n=1 Tax=Dromiciops gliroides TaxID=33562 RepID=UPI001CC428B9|nr:cytokine receptor common subunit gamma [Dromiciops gliroides]
MLLLLALLGVPMGSDTFSPRKSQDTPTDFLPMSTTPVPLPKVECWVFNVEFMNCTWDGGSGPQSTNLTLYYWYRDPPKECSQYLFSGAVTSGCWFDRGEINIYSNFNVELRAPGRHFKQEMKLKDLVIPWAPENLTVYSVSDSQLELNWTSSYKAMCLQHLVQYKSDIDSSWTEQYVNQRQQFFLPSVDEHKLYMFRVQSRFRPYCGNAKQWSQWSPVVQWGGRSPRGTLSRPMMTTVFVPLGLLIGFVFLIVMLIRLERVWVILMPQIPNLKNLDDLVTTYHGNFSTWSGVSKGLAESLQPDYSERLCHVSELPPKSGAQAEGSGGSPCSQHSPSWAPPPCYSPDPEP